MGRELAAEIGRLIEDGLARYGQGDLDGALSVWELVLSLDPNNAQAHSYVDYVRINYDALAADGNTDRGPEGPAPFPLADESGEHEYQIEIAPGELQVGVAKPVPASAEPLDQGWMIAAEAARGEPTRRPTHPSAAIPQVLADPSPLTLEFEADEPLPPARTDDVSFDEATREYPGGAGRPAHDLLGFEDKTPLGFSSETTDVRTRTLGFVQPRPDKLRSTFPGTPVGPKPGAPATSPLPALTKAPAKPAAPPAPGHDDDPFSFELAPMQTAPRHAGPPPISHEGLLDLELPLPAPVEPADSIGAAVQQIVPPASESSGSTRGAVPTRPLPGVGRAPAITPVEHLYLRESTRESSAELPVDSNAKTRDMPPLVQVQALESTYQDLRIQSMPTRDLGLRAQAATPSKRAPSEDETTTTMTQPRGWRTPTSRDELTPPPPPADLETLEQRAQRILDEVDSRAEVDLSTEPKEDRTRRRITGLMERAAQLAKSGDHTRAVTAVDLALSEDSNSALAQKLVHRNRDAIMSAFQAFLGDLNRAPVLSRPLHELAGAPISPRAAFLLSRVDGTLSLDEILDVSGMPRLEAYRYLCQLFLRGILR